MEGRRRRTYEEQAQLLADLHEYLDLIRYPTRVEMLRAVDEAAQRADCLARLDNTLLRATAAR
ncbi:MAG: hypothetical protein JF886_01495 [Candidatus Dormibacteraeota bacterium]|uniref:Uncharacterized protein n=1 Tax=Candidatus Aeolococcus gillhamiae TaxID=3127015 RepID=A0A2W5Z829_9BACT|nr:hypothetical protein [Candidatus Dormibacteraeota bacterium]PZR81540.1 MAG: hypothetical protein DLM65_05630 [Candidatus Dormibacter sp. RRmetagenome_bin12]